MRKTLAVAVAAVLLVSCTSGDEGSDSTDPATTESVAPPGTTEPATADTEAPAATDATEPPSDSAATTDSAPDDSQFVDQSLDGPAPGVTDDTIRVGITFLDTSSAPVSLNQGDWEAAYRTYIDELNSRGGVNGRTIDPVFVPISLADGGNADAVCLQLTQDEDVFVVMGFFLDDAPLCYLELHEKALLGGTITPDIAARAKAPWFATFGTDAEADAIAKFAEAGVLDGSVGLYASAASEPVITSTVLPALEAAGVEPVEVAINDAPATDIAASDAQAATILQVFESSGVDTILTVGNDGTGAAQALEASGYRPQLVTTNFSSLNAFIAEAGRDLSVLDGAVGAGPYGPVADIYAEADMVECIEQYQAAGNEWVDPTTWTEESGQDRNWVSMNAACGTIRLFEALAGYAGPNLNYATFQESGYTIGDVKLPGSPEPFFYGPPPSTDGDNPVYLFNWDPAAGEFARE